MGEPRYRILMADDVTLHHVIYNMAITEVLPAHVEFAVNGEETLVKLATPLPYDLLILDLDMPKMGGEETLSRLRSDPTYDTMPVLVLTGDSDEETHRRLLDLGADDFLVKGSPPETFLAHVKAQINHKTALDRLNKLALDMDIFAAGVLHDIRNLETNILSVCELTRAYLDDDPVAHAPQMLQDLAAIEAKSEQLGRYAGEIIKMARATQKPLAPKPVDLVPLLTWVVRIAAPEISDTTPKLRWRVEGELIPVVADPHFLQLALLNLVQNAVKYRRPEAAPEVTLWQRPGGEAAAGVAGSATVITCLSDNGMGIPKAELRRVFEPFVRGYGQHKQTSGFGLGLSLVQKVVTSMGGKVWAEANPPLNGALPPGVTMCLELPREVAATPDENAVKTVRSGDGR